MFKNITLEISLKPFKKTDPDSIRVVCRKLFEQWKPLIKNRETVSILMWSSDGSELLDYAGRAEAPFEWCSYVGTANKPLLGDNEPLETSPHERKQPYIPHPPVMTYEILKTIVQTFKEEGTALLPGTHIRVGTTFDIGPEFAISDFKYHRHPEVCNGSGCDRLGFVDATALLKGDTHTYAAYPNGIPDGTPMGTFLGAQAQVFMHDCGFDYIWLSNGMGFCYEPWSDKGKIYDGQAFHPEKLADTREKVFLFWKLFREKCSYPIETRGTNYSVGIDYASDGVPLYDIYHGNFNITPPPNSPWATINDNIGIELLGQLSRNCELPGNDYMFRFYLHDIWWMNSPWYDRYDSNPYDIYLPMALSRIDENGSVQTPSLFNILSVDNSMGELPDACANEAIPHMLKAEKNAPDAPAPVVLVYPLREYTTAEGEEALREMYFADTFLQNALNAGFPITSVVSADNFAHLSPELFRKSVLLAPAGVLGEQAKAALAAFAQNGGGVIAYGSQKFLDTLVFSAQKVDIYGDVLALFDAWRAFGYSVEFVKEPDSPLPSMTVHRHDNALFFSVYNRDTTVETRFRFPLGAPVLLGYNTKITNGTASYHFPRSVHGECRVFVDQKSGVVRAKEESPVNMKYRRRIRISGLDHAKVCLFGEEYCKKECIVTAIHPDATPVALDNFRVVEDPEHGTYLYGEDISGTISLCMPR